MNDINPISKKKFGEIFLKTLEKETALRKMGYKVVVIWEHEWNQFVKTDKYKEFIKNLNKNFEK